MPTKTALVTGASGMPRNLYSADPQGFWVVRFSKLSRKRGGMVHGPFLPTLTLRSAVGTGLTRSDPPRIRKLDLSDFTALEDLINEICPTVIVHRFGLQFVRR